MLSTKVHPETSKQKTGSSGKSEEEGLSVWVEHTTSCFFFYAHDPNNVAVGPGYLGTHITLGKYRARGGGDGPGYKEARFISPRTPARQLRAACGAQLVKLGEKREERWMI